MPRKRRAWRGAGSPPPSAFALRATANKSFGRAIKDFGSAGRDRVEDCVKSANGATDLGGGTGGSYPPAFLRATARRGQDAANERQRVTGSGDEVGPFPGVSREQAVAALEAAHEAVSARARSAR